MKIIITILLLASVSFAQSQNQSPVKNKKKSLEQILKEQDINNSIEDGEMSYVKDRTNCCAASNPSGLLGINKYNELNGNAAPANGKASENKGTQ